MGSALQAVYTAHVQMLSSSIIGSFVTNTLAEFVPNKFNPALRTIIRSYEIFSVTYHLAIDHEKIIIVLTVVFSLLGVYTKEIVSTCN